MLVMASGLCCFYPGRGLSKSNRHVRPLICRSVALLGSEHIVPRDKETVSAALEGVPISAAFMGVHPRVCCAFSASPGLWRRKRKAWMHSVVFCVWGLFWFLFDPLQSWCNLGELAFYFKVLFRLQRFNRCSTGVGQAMLPLHGDRCPALTELHFPHWLNRTPQCPDQTWESQ